jgi:hypothetical protein
VKPAAVVEVLDVGVLERRRAVLESAGELLGDPLLIGGEAVGSLRGGNSDAACIADARNGGCGDGGGKEAARLKGFKLHGGLRLVT